jgi:hypothetical protein
MKDKTENLRVERKITMTDEQGERFPTAWTKKLGRLKLLKDHFTHSTNQTTLISRN